MKIGITYDLKSDYLKMGFTSEEAAEFDKEDTIDGIENTLTILGFETERIGHVKNLANELISGKKWDLVFNICEGMYGIGREAQVPALLDAWNIPYVFSNPLVLSLTLHKAMTKRVLRDAGIPTADFYVVYNEEDIENIKLPYPLFAKPLAEGTGKGINANSFISTKEQLIKVCQEQLVKYKQPVLVETYLSGREFTVGITGTGKEAEIVGVMEVTYTEKAEANIYTFANKDDYEVRIKYSVPEFEMIEKCKQVALDSWNILECEDGGRVDIRCDEFGVPNFIEVNPLAGLNPTHSDLPILGRLNDVSYEEIIRRIMDSAVKKVKK
ncbi:MAG: hypothetical protein JXL97_05310 [Bacteroidales bacterium]|nr:hypothetical protein [Bacteroidales bacterium]